MSSCLSWIVLTTPHYDSSASVSMLIASPIPWCQIVLFFDGVKSSFFPWCQILLFFRSMVSNCPRLFWCQIVLFTLMVSNCPLFSHCVKMSPVLSWHQIVLGTSTLWFHCAGLYMLMKPRCWHRRRLEGGLICPQPLVLSKTRSDQITPNQTILYLTIHYTFRFHCI